MENRHENLELDLLPSGPMGREALAPLREAQPNRNAGRSVYARAALHERHRRREAMNLRQDILDSMNDEERYGDLPDRTDPQTGYEE